MYPIYLHGSSHQMGREMVRDWDFPLSEVYRPQGNPDLQKFLTRLKKRALSNLIFGSRALINQTAFDSIHQQNGWNQI